MRFNHLMATTGLIFWVLTPTACGGHKGKKDVARKQIFASNSYVWRSSDTNRVIVAN